MCSANVLHITSSVRFPEIATGHSSQLGNLTTCHLVTLSPELQKAADLADTCICVIFSELVLIFGQCMHTPVISAPVRSALVLSSQLLHSSTSTVSTGTKRTFFAACPKYLKVFREIFDKEVKLKWEIVWWELPKILENDGGPTEISTTPHFLLVDFQDSISNCLHPKKQKTYIAQMILF